MLTATKSASARSTVKGSRFIAEIFPCPSAAAAREILKSQKEKRKGASHVVHAFSVGPRAETLGMSDDGEPQGTAGRSALDALLSRGVSNAIVTVARWFGGTLLGTGGLSRAYGAAAAAAIDAAAAEGALEEIVEKRALSFHAVYALREKALRALSRFGAEISSESFSDGVSISATVRAENFAALSAALSDLSAGAIKI